MQVFLIVDVPTVYRRVVAAGMSAGLVEGALVHFDRAFLLVIFVALTRIMWSAESSQVPAAEMGRPRTETTHSRSGSHLARGRDGG